MALTKALKYKLKASAHALKPTILLGAKGLTTAVIHEIDNTLAIHELIKIKLNGVEKTDKNEIVNSICQQLDAEFIQVCGNIATIYRVGEKKFTD